MSKINKISIFGEVLFDCFPSGEKVLGGAPFNVAWHLQSFGEQPQFISCVGDDELGRKILEAMKNWGMSTSSVQVNPNKQTGQVEIKVKGNQHEFEILPDRAYDYIKFDDIQCTPPSGILYHGTLGLRNQVSRDTFLDLTQKSDVLIFLDVNLRSPWWDKKDVYYWMQRARWVKLNEDEMKLLGFSSADKKQEMLNVLSKFRLEHLILTSGEDGADVLTQEGEFYRVVPDKIANFVDTVGAGDAFTAIYIYGLVNDWPIDYTLSIAQQFASKIVEIRGAISTDQHFYDDFMTSLL